MKSFNLNDSIMVILTASGAETINTKNDLNRKMLESFGTIVSPSFFPTYKEGDRYYSQLWQLMQDFGPVMYMHSDVPFKNNEILFDDKDLEDMEDE